MTTYPSFSFIIPVKPGAIVSALSALQQLEPCYPFEVLVAEGCSPSRQRNSAAKQASGSILYFLDDDSLLAATALKQCAVHFQDESVAVVGGPSITPASDTPMQQLFGYALSSLIGAGAVRNRYRATGILRKSSQKELILCNLAIRRDLFLEMKGFDERLYPNEENELLDRIELKGLQILHDPALAVERSQRTSLAAFIRQMFNYGRGRGQQTRISRHFTIVSFIPLFFVCYLLLLPIAWQQHSLWLAPLLCYAALCITFTVIGLYTLHSLSALFLLFLYPLIHSANGFGLFIGLVRGVNSHNHSDSPIIVRTVKSFTTTF